MNALQALRTLTVCLAAGLSLPAWADGPAVRWVVLDFPPYHVVSGPQQGQGLRDKYLRALQAGLPQFSHSTEFASLARMAGLMQAGEPVCTISQLKTTEREAYAVFSRWPYAHQLPIRLVALPQTIARTPLLKQESVSLKRVLETTALTVGLVEKRSFGQVLDDVLASAQSNQVVRFSSDSVQAAQQVKLMEHGRFDLTLGYAVEIEWLRHSEPQLKPVSYIPLTESEALVPTYVSCARSEVGEAVIAAINSKPKGGAAQQALRRDYEALLPATERQRYRKQLERSGGD
jgi:uncharacterized protein (TIGR02285 family)